MLTSSSNSNNGSPDSTTQQSGNPASGAKDHHLGLGHEHLHQLRGSTASPASLMGDQGGVGNSNNSSAANTTTGSNSSCPPNMYSLKWNTQLLSLQRSLANLWDSGIGTDAVLLCQGTPLPVHKIVLTAASPYVASVVQVSSIICAIIMS